ncbi:MAG: NAD(P)-dependent oxidoreductase [Deltaproteobacteria bacterium]|nr:NAD(P)-dependent oxidoreductase [Deltaproteobacteria bacterium]
MRVAVTGGSGFIGTNMVDHFLSWRVDVRSFDHKPPRKEAHRPLWREVDICDRARLDEVLREFSPTHIVHLAAKTGMDLSDISFFAANMDGVQNLIDVARTLPKLQRVLFTSTLLVCRNGYVPSDDTDYGPPNLYGESKMRGEQIVRAAGPLPFGWTIVRPTAIWGPWFEAPYKLFFKMVERGLYFHPGRKPVFKAQSFVANTCYMFERLLVAAPDEVERRVFYLCDYPKRSVTEWATAIQRCMGVRRILTVPRPLLRAVARVGDAAMRLGWSDPPLSTRRYNNMLVEAPYPVERTERVVGPLPYTLENGVAETVRWLRDSNFR